MINAIAIDDEPLPLEIIESFCDDLDFIDLKNTFTQSNKALAYLESNLVDLIFLDIQMPAVSGIDFYKSLKKDIPVIFTTAHKEYAIEGFDLNAIDFLLKPYSYDRFMVAVNKAKELFDLRNKDENENSSYLIVKAEYSTIKIFFNSIQFIESIGDYLKIYVDDNNAIVTRMALKNVLDSLPNNFVRIHRSFVVPLERVEVYRNKKVFIAGQEIPVGTTYQKEFKKLFKD
ncbi:LytR/AlgR family response regulator transcription factor [Chondrinema litorale]|uniref:LytR/AlgR family response regulator transcription factor n=1 Tax=Chondrinema litorale TaxID=2994555 RepID=UPI00254341C7|nr:LytTR family DNA-binding domain-containing protein [Chondrinema litorale]UZR98695.1 LytTR family DNA-binding domain-containing protein [Chondrinema litorale]